MRNARQVQVILCAVTALFVCGCASIKRGGTGIRSSTKAVPTTAFPHYEKGDQIPSDRNLLYVKRRRSLPPASRTENVRSIDDMAQFLNQGIEAKITQAFKDLSSGLLESDKSTGYDELYMDFDNKNAKVAAKTVEAFMGDAVAAGGVVVNTFHTETTPEGMKAISELLLALRVESDLEDTLKPDPKPDPDPDPEPEPNPDKPDPSGSQEFLWKPESENDGKLVLLTPAGESYKRAVLASGGEELERSERPTRNGKNGNRQHFRFSKPGGGYPDGTTCILVASGKVDSYVIEDTSERFKK